MVKLTRYRDRTEQDSYQPRSRCRDRQEDLPVTRSIGNRRTNHFLRNNILVDNCRGPNSDSISNKETVNTNQVVSTRVPYQEAKLRAHPFPAVPSDQALVTRKVVLFAVELSLTLYRASFDAQELSMQKAPGKERSAEAVS